MTLPDPVPGLVIAYSYLWRDQSLRGETEGRKNRPCAIVMAARREDGETLVYVVPVTHAPPRSDRDAVELPAALKRRLKLDAAPAWIVTSELNRFVWPGYDLRNVSREEPGRFAWGFLSVEIFQSVKDSVLRNGRARGLAITDRS